MQIIPVIDILHAVVVRGIAGLRETYKRVESVLTDQATVHAVGGAMTEFHAPAIYVADLDAIAGGKLNYGAYRELIDHGHHLWIDTGLCDTACAENLATFQHAGDSPTGVIAALETLTSPQLLEELLNCLTGERLIFSLDMMQGEPLTRCPEIQKQSPRQLIDWAAGLGVRRMIFLDLAQVGMATGTSTLPLVCYAKEHHPGVEIISGGGVRDEKDVETFAREGCDALLVASALHNGRITPEFVRQWNNLAKKDGE